MNKSKECSLWVHCPICGGKTRTKVYENTVLVKFPLYCPKCKKEVRIDVVQLKMVLSKEQTLKVQSQLFHSLKWISWLFFIR